MKIHSNVITAVDVHRAAANLPGVYVNTTGAGSRSRRHGVVITLTSDGTPDQHGNARRRRTNGGTRGAGFDRSHAASWADWGHLLGALYALDPDMVCPYYSSRDDFDRQTGGRFIYALVDLVPALTVGSSVRLKVSSVNLSRHELAQHGW